MYGGQDKGFVFSYWRLSYGRKFIRTVVGSALGIAVAVAFMVSQPEVFGWPWYAALPIAILGSIWYSIYIYRRWQTERRENNPPSTH